MRFGVLAGAGVLAIALVGLALFFLSYPVNIAAYYLGYGEEMRVEVVEGSRSLGPPVDSKWLGEGRVVGEGRTVGIYHVTTGEVITARPRLIDLGAQEKRYVYHGQASVLVGLASIIPVFLFGLPGMALLMAFTPKRWRDPYTAWLTRYLSRLSPKLRNHSGPGDQPAET